MLTKRAVLVGTFGLFACRMVTDPFTPITVSGTVTQSGEPAPASITLSAGSFSTTQTVEDGSYTITVGGGGVPESNCSSASIRARLLASDLETVLAEETRQLGACGSHTVDFEFP